MSWLNVPNLLTLTRLVLSPVVVWSIVSREFGRALVLLVAAGTTDFFDGMLARRAKCSTRMGAYLDPIADKLLLSSSYVALGIVAAAPWWLVGLIFGRDLLILAISGAALLFTPLRDFPPSLWGKLSTGVQVATAFFLLAARAFPAAIMETCAGVLIWLAAVATAWSGFDYARLSLKRIASLPRSRME